MHKEMNTVHLGRILVVDDTSANLQLLTNLLTAHGYTVHPASDGELALEFVRSTLPDLILLDIRMPGMDGYEVCRRLKADERTRDIPVIFISILEDERDKVKGFQAGAVDYITKPFQAEEVLARVRIHLQLRELTEHLEKTVAQRTEELHTANAQLQRELAERKQTEAALRQSETLLNTSQRLAKIGGWDWNIEQQVSFWTEETYRIHGFEPRAFAPGSSEYIDRSLSCYDPADRPIISEAFQRCVQQGDGYDLELPFTSADGCRKWIRTTAAAVREEGRIVKVVGTIMDITERKQVEAERQAQLLFFENMDRVNRAIQENKDLGQMMSDVLDVVLSVLEGDRAYLLYPCAPDSDIWTVPMERNRPEYPGVLELGLEMPMTEEVATTIRLLLQADDPLTFGPGGNHPLPEDVAERFGFHCFMATALYPKTGQPWQFGIHQCTHVRQWTDDEKRFFEAVGQRLADALTSLLSYRNLLESEEKYRTLIQKIQAAVVVHGSDTQVLTSNSLAQELLGLTEDQMFGKKAIDPAWHFFQEDGTTMPLDKYPVNIVLATGQSLRGIIAGIHRPDKAIENDVWVLVNADPVFDSDNKIIQVIVTFIDITEHKQAEEELSTYREHLEEMVRERTAELEAANKEMHAFTYTVSHDLRAPLRHIDGFLELLQKRIETAIDEQSRHYMNTISNAAQKMGLLIDDLLSFSRMGRHAISFQPVDLGTLVRDVIAELESDAAGRDIDWRIGELPTVSGDAALLRMVMANLIANALKFTRPRQQAQIEIGSIPGETSETVIFVRDNGVGFDMAYADKLFGVFQRLHHADEFEGTGIGLANVRRIIARHGGRTWAEGKPDRGATIYFALPYQPDRHNL